VLHSFGRAPAALPHNMRRRAHPPLAVGLERLAIFLGQVVEGRLIDVVFIEVGSIGVGASFLNARNSRFLSEGSSFVRTDGS
jgi:hypothetical protein